MSGYLFAHFTGDEKDGEQIYFSVSMDGLHWTDLNRGRPILYARLGTKGARDPFLIRDPESGTVYLLATDLCIGADSGLPPSARWQKAQYHGSRDLLIWESRDLVHWSDERSYTIGLPGAGCVWAPEAVYDRQKKAFLVFFASMTKNPEDTDPKQRIYASYTNNFREFSRVFLYMERESHVIDATILENDGRYYRISKEETNARLVLEESDSLLGHFRKISSPTFDALPGVEGPEGYLLPDGKTWCVIADQFASGKGYLPMLTENLSSGIFRILAPEEYDFGATRKRHGGILQISDTELAQLLDNFNRTNPVINGLYADPDLYYEDGTYYIYPTTDGFPNWSGHEFFVFSSKDGKHFEKAGRLLDVAAEDVPWAVGYAWAPCIAKRNGKYYLYFCAKDKSGTSCIGVAKAASPTGPFRAMEQPLVTIDLVRRKKIAMGQTIDPSVFCENGDFYLVFGNGGAAIVKLTADMIHIEEETMREIRGLEDFRESLIITKRNGLYHLTWSCDDTGSEKYHVNYGVTKSLWEPVTFCGAILQKDTRRGILGTGHHSILQIPEENRCYIAYHRFATPPEDYPEGKGFHRETCIAPLMFDAEGLMMPVVTV